MKCPRCDLVLAIADRQGIEIDYCPQCRGVWLDRGELDKIVERSLSRSFHDHDDDWDEHAKHTDGDYYRHRKRKSFLGELFDLG